MLRHRADVAARQPPRRSAITFHCLPASTGGAVSILAQCSCWEACEPRMCSRSVRSSRSKPAKIHIDVVEDFARCCNYYRVSAIAADGNGNGHVYNRLLFAKVKPRSGIFAIYYSAGENEPTADGVLWRWTVNRSASIGVLFGRIKRKQLLFPCRQDTDSYLNEFACVTAEYDDQQRAIKYVHPQTQPDDALHATNYALLIATRFLHAVRGQSLANELMVP